jgi:hypothetical protein
MKETKEDKMENRNVRLLAALVFSTLLVGLTLHTLARSSEAARPAQSDPPGEWRIESIREPFVAIEMLSQTDGWAAAGNHFYHYNGAGWRLTYEIEDATIYDFDMVTPNEGWAVGELPSMGGTAFGSGIWHYDGTAWQSVPSPTDWPIYSIDMLSEDEGWAVSYRDSIHYDGVSWETIPFSVSQSGGWTIPIFAYDVDAIAAEDLWMVGYDHWSYRGVIYHYDGDSWIEASCPITEAVRGISMLSTTEGWAVGGGYLDYEDNWVDGSAILHYSSGQWQSVTSPITTPLHAVHMVSKTKGWASSETEILHYDGTSWQVFTDTAGFSDLSMLSTTEGWAVNGQGQVLHCSEENWHDRSELLDPGNFTSFNLHDVDMISETAVWAVGGSRWYVDTGWQYTSEILQYEGDRRWVRASSPVTWSLNAVDMISETDGWAVGEHGSIVHHNGANWEAVSSPVTCSLHAVDMISSTEGWVVGGDSFKTCPVGMLWYDGADWMTVTNPAEGLPLSDIDMISSTEGWAVGGEYDSGLILHYEAGDWVTVTVPPSVTHIGSIDMASAVDGWAVEQYNADGTLLHYNGSTWEKVSTDHLGLQKPYFDSLYMVSETEGWITGVSKTGESWHMHNLIPFVLYYDGTNWRQISLPIYSDLLGISMLDGDTGRIVGDDGLILRIDPPLADLVITDMRIEPATPRIDEPITLTVDVENQGQGQTWIWSEPEAAWFAVEVYAKRSGGPSDNPFDHQGGSVGDRWEYTAYPAGLAPGEEETLTFQIVLTETGTYSLYAQADVSWEGLDPPWGMAFGVIDEADELNNVYTFGAVELYSSEVFLPLVLRLP